MKAKTFQPTEAQILAAGKVFICMASTECIRPDVEKIKQSILDKFSYGWNPDVFDRVLDRELGQFCKNDKYSYLMADNDFGHYMTELNHAYKLAGFDVPLNYCPLLIAESKEREAKRELANSMESITGLKADDLICSGLDNYKKYIELTLKLLAPYVKKVTDPILKRA